MSDNPMLINPPFGGTSAGAPTLAMILAHRLFVNDRQGVRRANLDKPKRQARTPTPERIGPNTPVRLEAAAALMFPDGSITAKALQREARRGRLAVSKFAGKTYTTIRSIQESMGDLWRGEENNRSSSLSEPSGETARSPVPRPGSSATADAKSALDAARLRLKKLASASPTTSSRRTPRPENAIARRTKS